jgi:hypothetical protein
VRANESEKYDIMSNITPKKLLVVYILPVLPVLLNKTYKKVIIKQ